MSDRKQPGENRDEGRGVAMATSAIALVVCLALTALLATSVQRSSREDAESAFRQSAQQTSLGVKQEIDSYFTSIEDVGALVGSVPAITRDQFRDYVASARVFERLPSLVGMLYLERVTEEQFPAWLERTRASNPEFNPFPISTEETGWPRYYLMQWVAGDADLPLPVGAEVTSIKTISDLLKVSSLNGKGVVGSFQHDPFLQKVAKAAGQVPLSSLLALDFFIGVPVFAPPQPGQPRGEAIGWTAAPVARFQEVVAQAAKGTPQGLGMSLSVDLTDVGMDSRQDVSRVAQQEGTAGPRDRSAFQHDETFENDGVVFRLSVWSTADAAESPTTVTFLFVGGVFGSIFVASIFYLRMRARSREMALAEALTDRALFQREIVDSVTSAMVVLDSDGGIVASNPAWSELLGFQGAAGADPPDVGLSYMELMDDRIPGSSDPLASRLRRVLRGEEDLVELDVPMDEGRTRRWFSVRATPLRGVHGGAVVIHTDITERKRTHDELQFKASRDNLTGLLNRDALEIEMDDAMRHARANGSSVAILFIDLDGFKRVNDDYGHAVGDEVLRSVSTRISAAVRTTDRVARIGGDEFVVLIAPLASAEVASTTAERILRAFNEPMSIGDNALPISASVGVSIVDAPLDASGDDLLLRADEAMYRAKQLGGSTFQVS